MVFATETSGRTVMAGAEQWAEIASWIGAGIGAIVLALWKGRKSVEEPKGEMTVMSGALLDTNLVRELTRAINEHREQHHEDNTRLRGVLEELIMKLKLNTEAQSEGAVTPAQMLEALAKLGK